MNKTRKKILEDAYNGLLDNDQLKEISLEDFKLKFNPKFHPAVLDGKKTEDNVLLDFLSSFETFHEYLYGMPDKNTVSLQEFQEYYSYLDLLFDTDEDFKHYIESVWQPLNTAASNKDKKGNTLLKTNLYLGEQKETHKKQKGNVSDNFKKTYSIAKQKVTDYKISAEQEVANLRRSIARRGPKALNILLDITEKLILFDEDNGGEVSITGFMRVLEEYKIEDNIDSVLSKYKGSSKETIRYKDFLQELIQPLPSHRKNLVIETFSKTFTKPIRLISMYDPTEDPFVITGRQTKANAILGLEKAINTHSKITLNKSDRIRKTQLIDLFKYWSATIESNKDFIRIIKKCWRVDKKLPKKSLSGKKGKEPIVRKEFELKPPFGISKEKTLYVTTQQDMSKKAGKIKPESKTKEMIFAELRKYLKEGGIRKIVEVQNSLQVFTLLII